MILIVNTTTDTGITDRIRSELDGRSDNVEMLEAGEWKITHCMGCNHCWLKTPGICSITDDYDRILRKMVQADQLWVISDTALGFLDHKGKNIFDRMMPLATMNLKVEGKQMRHILRYDKRTDIGIIYRGGSDKDYLKRWNERAALNFGSRSLGVYDVSEVKEAVSCVC